MQEATSGDETTLLFGGASRVLGDDAFDEEIFIHGRRCSFPCITFCTTIADVLDHMPT